MIRRLRDICHEQCAALRDPLRRRVFFITFAALSSLCAIIVGSYLYTSYVADRQELEEGRNQAVDERFDRLHTGIVARISDIFLLPSLPALREFMERPTPTVRAPLEEYLTTVAERDRDIDDIRILDAGGKEMLRISKSDAGAFAVPAGELQDISDRYYFHEAAELPPASYYVSALDLDVEYGDIEVPWEPTLRIGAPLFSSRGQRLGLVLINVNFSALLKPFTPNYRGEHDATLLLNNGGYILAGAPDELLWGFMFQNGSSFAGREPEIWNAISASAGGQLHLNDRLVTFRTVAPLAVMRDQFAARRSNFVGSVGTWQIVDIKRASFAASPYNVQAIAAVLAGLLTIFLTSWLFSRFPAERIQLLRRQRLQEHRINALLDNTAVSITVRDLDGRFSFANAEYCRLLGRTREALVGQTLHDVLPPAIVQATLENDKRLTLENPSVKLEQEISNFAAQKRAYVLNKFLLFDEDGRPDSICTVGLEVTDLKNAENEARDAKEVAEMANRAKSDFLAAMSHEIRTPLNGVVGMVDLLRDSGLTQDQEAMVTTVRDSAYTLLGIIGDILDFSKLEAGRMTLDVAPVSVCEIVESVMQALCGLGYAKGLMMPLFCDPEIPALVKADPIRLRQILYNLLGNAVKFTDSVSGRRGEVVFRADVADRGPGKVKVRYSIADNGIGMDDDTKARLFRPFEQGERSTARRYGGTGLGLSICRQLAEMMEGELTAVSAVGVGSTFAFEIWHEVVELGRPPFDLTGKHILFVGRRATASIASYLSRYVSHCGGAMDWVYALEDAPDRLMSAVFVGQPFDCMVIGPAVPYEVKAALRDRLHATPHLESLRYVFMSQTVTEAPRIIDNLTVSVSGRPLCRSVILPAIAIACGCASPGTLSVALRAAAPAVEPPTIEEADKHGQLILIAEDNPINRDVLRRQIATLGFAAEIVENGAEALALLRRRRYALLLTDCHMPEMDGYELTRKIRTGESDGTQRLPIIAITANALHGEAERCFEVGMDDYLSKPIELRVLREKLHRWMPDAGVAKPVRAAMAEPAAAPATPPAAAASFDPSILKRLVGGSEDTAIEILGDFGDSAREILAEITEAHRAHSAANIAMAAHKLKSSSRAVGADAAAEVAERLERAGKTEAWGEIDTAAPELDGALRVALELIEAHIDEFLKRPK